MSTTRELHNRAMAFVDQALRKRALGNTKRSLELFGQALESELAAIGKLPEQSGLAWSILHRSAGTMALDCNNFRLAEQLAIKALAGDPHPEIVDELRDLWEQANFHRHLELNEVKLGIGEVQLSLVGGWVASGITLLSDLQDRMDSFEKLVFRIAQRRAKNEYNDRIPPEIQKGYRTFVSVPRRGSFAISLMLGHTPEQLSFSDMLDTEEVISELMDLLELADAADTAELEARIPNEAYRRNFLVLAKKLAPDGDRIRQVGFTRVSHGEPRTLSVTTPASQFPSPHGESPRVSRETVVKISGTLQFANAIGSKSNLIKLVDSNQVRHNVRVPDGMMDDIVRPMWNSVVTVRGTRRHGQKLIRLQEIWDSDRASDQNDVHRVAPISHFEDTLQQAFPL